MVRILLAFGFVLGASSVRAETTALSLSRFDGVYERVSIKGAQKWQTATDCKGGKANSDYIDLSNRKCRVSKQEIPSWAVTSEQETACPSNLYVQGLVYNQQEQIIYDGAPIDFHGWLMSYTGFYDQDVKSDVCKEDGNGFFACLFRKKFDYNSWEYHHGENFLSLKTTDETGAFSKVTLQKANDSLTLDTEGAATEFNGKRYFVGNKYHYYCEYKQKK